MNNKLVRRKAKWVASIRDSAITERVSYGRHRITYLDDIDVEVVLRAQLGQSTKLIQAETGLSTSQITYRLAKARAAQGFKVGNGYRTQWRNGTSPVSQRIFQQFGPKLHHELQEELPRHFIVPPAVTSPQK